jgi:hypothetical protein
MEMMHRLSEKVYDCQVFPTLFQVRSGAMIWAEEALIREKRNNEIIENDRNTLPDFLPLMLMPTPIITQSQR